MLDFENMTYPFKVGVVMYLPPCYLCTSHGLMDVLVVFCHFIRRK